MNGSRFDGRTAGPRGTRPGQDLRFDDGAIGPNFASTDPRRGANPGWVIGGMIMIAVFGALSYGALAAFLVASSGTLPVLVSLGGVLLAGSAAVLGGMLLVGLRPMERWRPGDLAFWRPPRNGN